MSAPRFRCTFVKTGSLFCAIGFLLSSSTSAAPLRGTVRIDGSSTVAPITMAAAELFQQESPRVRVTVGISGTGGGFKKFLEATPDLRTDISDASRPISPEEIKRAKELGVEFMEVPIGLDGIAVVVHPSNRFCSHLSVEELKRIWKPGSAVTKWSDVRPNFPDEPIRLYGPGTDSGTFEYFTEVIVGKPRASRSDYTASESDNMLVQGVSGDPSALGYFGFAYYEANENKLKLLGVSEKEGAPIHPTRDTIRAGTYHPLARPMFLYVNKACYTNNEAVRGFLKFVYENAGRIVEHPRVGYVALPDELYALSWQRLEQGKTGSVISGTGTGHVTDLLEIYRGGK